MMDEVRFGRRFVAPGWRGVTAVEMNDAAGREIVRQARILQGAIPSNVKVKPEFIQGVQDVLPS